MYVVRQEATIVGGQASAYLERAKRQGEVAGRQKGFVGRLLLNSFGYPQKYTILTTWESREAARASALGPGAAFVRENPLAGIATPSRPNEAYAVIHDVSGSGEPGSVVLVEWTLDARPGNAAAFEASRKEVFELAKKHVPGFVSSQLLRFLGAANKYVAVRQNTNRDALAPVAPPEVQAYNAAHPATGFASTLNITDRYEVIQRL